MQDTTLAPAEQTRTIDSYLFLDFLTRKLVTSWIAMERPRETPWTPLTKPLADCTVALLSSGGIALKTDSPFDQAGEWQNPWWGDPTHRVIPHGTKTDEIEVYHMHIDRHFAREDMNCLLPVDRLEELAVEGFIGRAATRHYAIMGYLLQPEEMLAQTVPQIIAGLQADGVDLLVLVPS